MAEISPFNDNNDELSDEQLDELRISLETALARGIAPRILVMPPMGPICGTGMLVLPEMVPDGVMDAFLDAIAVSMWDGKVDREAIARILTAWEERNMDREP
jgi:hypothetical protein